MLKCKIFRYLKLKPWKITDATVEMKNSLVIFTSLIVGNYWSEKHAIQTFVPKSDYIWPIELITHVCDIQIVIILHFFFVPNQNFNLELSYVHILNSCFCSFGIKTLVKTVCGSFIVNYERLTEFPVENIMKWANSIHTHQPHIFVFQHLLVFYMNKISRVKAIS